MPLCSECKTPIRVGERTSKRDGVMIYPVFPTFLPKKDKTELTYVQAPGFEQFMHFNCIENGLPKTSRKILDTVFRTYETQMELSYMDINHFTDGKEERTGAINELKAKFDNGKCLVCRDEVNSDSKLIIYFRAMPIDTMRTGYKIFLNDTIDPSKIQLCDFGFNVCYRNFARYENTFAAFRTAVDKHIRTG